MVIKAENTKFEKPYTVSGGRLANTGGIPEKPAPPESAPAPAATDGIKEDSLAELQQALHLVSSYAGKGSDLGVQSLQIVLLKSAAALYSGVTEERLGSALAAVVLLAQERGLDIEKIAHDKVRKMVTG